MAQLAEQPTAATPRIGKQGDPCVMVIFGAAGDLTARLSDSRALQPGARRLALQGVRGAGRGPGADDGRGFPQANPGRC